MRDIRDIKLLVHEDDGRTVWKTFRGKALVGTDTICRSYWRDQEVRSFWAVFQVESGRLVVFESDKLANDHGKLTVVDSFDALKAVVPEEILIEAEVKAGVRKLEKFPEEPLDV